MKRKLPLGIQTFRKIREENRYYVDKTGYALLPGGGRRSLLPRPAAPVREEPVRGHAEGAVRGQRTAVPAGSRSTTVGTGRRSASGGAARLRERGLQAAGLPAGRRGGAARRRRAAGTHTRRGRPACRFASGACWRSCTSGPDSGWSCWWTSTTGRSSTRSIRRRSPAPTATSCAGCTRWQRQAMPTSGSASSPASASSRR